VIINSMFGDIYPDPWFLLACAVAAGGGELALSRQVRVVTTGAYARSRRAGVAVHREATDVVQ